MCNSTGISTVTFWTKIIFNKSFIFVNSFFLQLQAWTIYWKNLTNGILILLSRPTNNWIFQQPLCYNIWSKLLDSKFHIVCTWRDLTQLLMIPKCLIISHDWSHPSWLQHLVTFTQTFWNIIWININFETCLGFLLGSKFISIKCQDISIALSLDYPLS